MRLSDANEFVGYHCRCWLLLKLRFVLRGLYHVHNLIAESKEEHDCLLQEVVVAQSLDGGAECRLVANADVATRLPVRHSFLLLGASPSYYLWLVVKIDIRASHMYFSVE